ELPRAAVGQIVAVDRSDDDVLETEPGGRRGDMFRLERIDLARHPGLDVAERAGARADVAEDHHRRVLLAPALADVRAGRLLADGVEAEFAHQRARLVVGLADRRLDPDPVRLALALGAWTAQALRREVVHQAPLREAPCQWQWRAPWRAR